MSKFVRAAAAAAALLTASPISAQTQFRVDLSPPSTPRRDVAGHVSWIGERKPPATTFDWDRGYGAGTIGVSGGVHWTRNLKLEFDAASSSEGEVYEQERIDVPGLPYPVIRALEHHYQTTTAGASVVWQFLENQWVHPFVSGGALLVRETGHVEAPQEVVGFAPPRSSVVLPAVESGTDITYTVRPTVTGGAKFYLSDRVFIRTDFRTSFSPDGSVNVGWRTGVGFDF